MTQIDFNHLLSSIEALSSTQVRRLRHQLDRWLAQPKTPPPKSSDKPVRRAKPDPRRAKKPLTEAQLQQHMLEIGLMSELPNTAADFDDPDDQPITIEGEPLSETIIRERR